ncbi:MAG: hypothetical protein M0Q26_06000 [Chitinophagaceae bacterium]|nr:hypothetical protein [Chitinophagaceae bacterium]
MKKFCLLLLLFGCVSALPLPAQDNPIYGKKVIIKTRDSSSAELQIINSTRTVTGGFLMNTGSGNTQFVMLPSYVLSARFLDSLVAVQGRIQTKLAISDSASKYYPYWSNPRGFITSASLAPSWDSAYQQIPTGADFVNGVYSLIRRSGQRLSVSLDGRYTKYTDTAVQTANYTLLDGTRANGTWNISITGNSGTVANGVYTTGSYGNPLWITSLAWAKITGTPTTLGGYGITDAYTKTNVNDSLAAVQGRVQTKSPLAGSGSIISVGTIASGVWNATAITDTYIASASAWNAKQNALGFTPENIANKGIANGYADLDALGKIPSSRIDFGQTGQTFVVASQVAMLAVSGANVGALAIRTDENKNYRLIGQPASTLANWQVLLSPDAPVQSVNGFTGNVNLLTTHISEGSNYYWTAARSRAGQSITTTGTSGAATYDNTTGILNIPVYQPAGTYVTNFSFTNSTGITGTVTNPTTTPTLSLSIDSSAIANFHIKVRSLFSAGSGISITNGAIASTITQYTDALARAAISAGTGISYNSTTGVITNTITQYTDALARAALSFVAGSGAYNSATGVITIPTNTNQLTNGAGFIAGIVSVANGGTGISTGETLATVTARGATTTQTINGTNIAMTGAMSFFGYNPITSYIGSYGNITAGGFGIMYRDNYDAYITSNFQYNATSTPIAKYTTGEGIGQLSFSGGNLSWLTYNGSVITNTAYALTTKFSVSSAGSITAGAASFTTGAFSDNITVTSASTKGIIVNSTLGTAWHGYTLQASGVTQGGIELYNNTGEIRIGGYSSTFDYYPVIYSDGVASLTFGLGATPSATFVGSISAGAASFSTMQSSAWIASDIIYSYTNNGTILLGNDVGIGTSSRNGILNMNGIAGNGSIIYFQENGINKGWIGNTNYIGGAVNQIVLTANTGYGLEFRTNNIIALNIATDQSVTLQGILNANAGIPNYYSAIVTGSSVSGQSYGLTVHAGTNSSDYSFSVVNQLNTQAYFQVRGDGYAIFSFGVTAAAFSGSGTGLTGTAAALTSGNVITNANLTGNVISVGNATTISAGVVTTGMMASANISQFTNNAGYLTTTSASLYSGEYTPATGTDSTNCTYGSNGTLTYSRNGSVVTISGSFKINPDGAGDFFYAIGLPSGWTISSTTTGGGAANTGTSTAANVILKPYSSTKIGINGYATATGIRTFFFTAQFTLTGL